MAARSKAWTDFAPSNAGIMGSIPTQGVDVCMRLLHVCIVFVAALRRADPALPTVYLLTYLLTELSPSWGAANSAATQELPSILWNPKVQYRVHKSPPLVPILSHIDPIHSIPSYLSQIQMIGWLDFLATLVTQFGTKGNTALPLFYTLSAHRSTHIDTLAVSWQRIYNRPTGT
jgi:hypothetical protein